MADLVFLLTICAFILVAAGFTYHIVKRKSKSAYMKSSVGRLWALIAVLIYVLYQVLHNNFSHGNH